MEEERTERQRCLKHLRELWDVQHVNGFQAGDEYMHNLAEVRLFMEEWDLHPDSTDARDRARRVYDGFVMRLNSRWV